MSNRKLFPDPPRRPAAELRSYDPPYHEQIVNYLTDWLAGPKATTRDRSWVNAIAGPDNPFNFPAQIERGYGNALTGYRRGDAGQMAGGAAEAVLGVAPFAVGGAAARNALVNALRRATPDTPVGHFQQMPSVEKQVKAPPHVFRPEREVAKIERRAAGGLPHDPPAFNTYHGSIDAGSVLRNGFDPRQHFNTRPETLMGQSIYTSRGRHEADQFAGRDAGSGTIATRNKGNYKEVPQEWFIQNATNEGRWKAIQKQGYDGVKMKDGLEVATFSTSPGSIFDRHGNKLFGAAPVAPFFYDDQLE